MTDARLLGSRYELGAPLGYGGMAEVHRGRDLRLGREVAVKVLRSDLARDPGFQARFRREAQNAAALNHPSIVAVYDTGEEMGRDGSLPFIVMEYVEGRTLKDVLVAEGRLMPQRALEITADVCAALDFSHRNGIIHRDMKPANVMLTANGTVKVMDFGIARAITSATAAMTQTSAVIGTAQYLSPEQARGETVDARSDVYSTGCLLYELLCGHPPFTGDNPVSVAYQHVREDPIPPGEINPDVTPDIDAIVLKAMAKNPINRYQSAAEMRSDLLRAAAGRPVAASPVYSSEERTRIIGGGGGRNGTGMIATEPVEPPRNRRALTWILVALAVIGVFALAAWGTSKLLGGTTEEKVAVPSVVGKPLTEARNLLTGDGFKVAVVQVESDAANKDKVIRQNPAAEEEVEKGTTVTLDVGRGPNQVTVPDLEGLDKDGALQSLQQNDLKGNFTTADGPEPANRVLRFSPKAGALVAKGSTVNVVLSNGKLKRVPDVMGLTEEQALSKLREEGFQGRVVTRIDANATEGTVIAQSPEQNSLREANTTVTITVAEKPEPTVEPTPSPSPTPSPTPTLPTQTLPTVVPTSLRASDEG